MRDEGEGEEKKGMPVELLKNEQELVKELGRRIRDRGDATVTALVLDMGCGTGRLAAYLSEEAGCEVLGIDVMRDKIERARRRWGRGVEFEVQSAESMALKDEAFDFVVSLKVLHEIPRPRIALREAIRVLKNQGRIFIIDWIGGIAATKRHAHASRYFTPQQLETLLSLTGFRDIVIEANKGGELMLAEASK